MPLPTASNPVVDGADIISKLSPLLFGSNSSKSETTSTTSGIDPTALAQSSGLLDLLTQRGSSTSQSDGVISDILYRAQLAFSPILGEEKGAGVYNSTVKKQLGDEAIARATAASTQAVLQSQQQALDAASKISSNILEQTKAPSKTSTGGARTQTPLKANAGLLGTVGATVAGAVATRKIMAMMDKKGAAGKLSSADNEMLAGDKASTGDFASGGGFDDVNIDSAAFGNAGGASGDAVSAATGSAFSADAKNSLLAQAGTNIDPVILSSDVSGGIIGGEAGSGQGETALAAGAAGVPDAAALNSSIDAALALPAGYDPLMAAAASKAGVEAGTGTMEGMLFPNMISGDTISAAGTAGLNEASQSDIFATQAADDAAVTTDAAANLGADELGASSFEGGPAFAAADVISGGQISSGFGDIASGIANSVSDTVSSFLDDSIICTELCKQGKLNKRLYILGSQHFAQYSKEDRKGYYFWSVPTVRHLRTKPNSLYSQFITKVFNLRARQIAGRNPNLITKVVERTIYYFCIGLARTLARNYEVA